MQNAYKYRAGIVFFIIASSYIAILINLFSLQIRQSTFFDQLAKNQYGFTLTRFAERASIFDRYHTPIAINNTSIASFCMPQRLNNKDGVYRFLQRHFPHAYQRLLQQPHAPFFFIKRNLSSEQYQLIKQCGLDDIKLLQEPHRYYPCQCLGPIVGITNIDNKGAFGIEYLFDQQLTGTPSKQLLERDARSGHYYFSAITTSPGAAGTPIHLTIDSTLQFLAFEHLKDTINKFKAQEGAVLIINPKNGEMLVNTQWPLFDPADTHHLNIAHTKAITFCDAYELGSVMKVFVALAALEEDVVRPEELIDCQNSKTTFINNIRVNTWKAHGIIPFKEVVQRSNNIGIAQVALRLGKKLYEHYKKMGFEQKTAINWPAEQKGFINPPSKWSKQSIISLSFGYEIQSTLIQLAQAFCIIANHGYPVTLRLIQSTSIPNMTSVAQTTAPLYRSTSIATIRTILQETVMHGTAHRAALKGYTVMGKTGTANLLLNGKYQADHNTFTFAGIVEKGDYSRVIVTFIKAAGYKNVYASQVAAPLFERIAQSMLIHERIL